MNLCTDHADEVCYDSRECPACAIQRELDNANEKLEQAEATINDQETELRDLRASQ